MDIYVLNGLSGIKDIIDTFSSCIWTMQYFDVNDFELIVPGTERNVDLLTAGAMLVRASDISNGTYKNVMVVENIELDFDVEKGWQMKVTGGGLKKIVGRRIVWTQTNLSGTVEDGIRRVITENIISPSVPARVIPGFTMTARKGFPDTFEAQLFGNNISEWLVEVCQQYGYGWDVYIANGGFVFDLYQGTDRTYNQSAVTPVVFSAEFDNLASSTYQYEKADFKNAALVGGEGEGTSQRSATVGTASGLDRYEAYIDGGSVSSNGEIISLATYIKLLQQYGQEQLTGTAFTEKFGGEIINTPMYQLGRDYFLGDMVQIDNRFMQAKSRIIELIYSEDENGSSFLPTFSDWEG